MCLAVPGKILSRIEGEGNKGRVDFGGTVKEVDLTWVPDAKIGDFVVVHVGFALSIVDEKEAQTLFDCMDQIKPKPGDL